MRRVVPMIVACGLLTAAPEARTQIDPLDHYRIFLRDGDALPSYGHYAVVGDRIVFTLPIGPAGAPPELQLMSLPLDVVDMERTTRYTWSLQAARYAATRGEADYVAMTDEVARTIDQLRDVEDPGRRLALAEEAKQHLLAWSRENYSYRAADITELAGMFDEIIVELRAAAGDSSIALDLRSGVTAPASEPLRGPPTLVQSIALALRASSVADLPEDRVAVLRTARAALAARGEDGPLSTAVSMTLEAELEAGRAYAALEDEMLRRAEAAVARDDLSALESLLVELEARDDTLGRRRPRELERLRATLMGFAETAAARRLARERYAGQRAGRLAYERRVRPAMSALDGLRPVLEAIRDQRPMSFRTFEVAHPRAERLPSLMAEAGAPDDLADVHATLVSAIAMARHALDRWRLAAVTAGSNHATDASVAASGSLLLAARAREMLVERLRPPKAP